MPSPTIVINAFNRPLSLKRLLESLCRAWTPDGTRLVFSIDPGGDPAVRQIAERFAWMHGKKEVLTHSSKMGLVGHFLFCGGLTRRFGDIIYLEDDLYVSRAFYDYAQQALAAFSDDNRIAGLSLNRLHFNGYTQLPFDPILDGTDAFFAQIYWYQGQVYTPDMWDAFETWWKSDRCPVQPADGLHPLFLAHPRWENDFFPDAMHYLAATGRTFAFPRASHTTHFGDAGTHFAGTTAFFQVPLQNNRISLRFHSLDSAAARYDHFLEIQPEILTRSLPGFDFDVDLNGTKPLQALKKEFVLTTRPVRSAEMTFALDLRPPEMNILEGAPGKGISLARRSEVRYDALSDRLTAARLRAYSRRRLPSLREALIDRIVLQAARIAGR